MVMLSVSSSAQCIGVSVQDGLYINEFGQGDTGSEDWIELLVITADGGTLDLTDWIIDDNGSNDQACSALTSVLSGTRIVIYNDGDPYAQIPPDELFANDYTLVLPASSLCFDANGGNDYTQSDDGTNPRWGLVSFRNLGDAVTVATPSGIFHQLYYGDVDLTEVLDGGFKADIGNVVEGRQVAFNCSDNTDASNYSVVSLGTPTAPNNIENQYYVDMVAIGNLDCSNLEASCRPLGNPCDQTTIEVPCDDNNPCTMNDRMFVSESDNTHICVPCQGSIDPNNCNTSCTTTQPCDDGDPLTTDDVVHISASGIVCRPCAGTPPCTPPMAAVVATCTDETTAANLVQATTDTYYAKIELSDLGSDSDGDNQVSFTYNGNTVTYDAIGTYYVVPFMDSVLGSSTIDFEMNNLGET